MSGNTPSYLYKLVPSTAPVREPLPDHLPVSEIDQKSGFVHLSTALQVPNTLKFFFKDEPLVYVLRIPYDRVAHDIRFEDPEGRVCGPRPEEGLFPHLYNGLKLGRDEVESISVWTNEEGWDKRLAAVKPWLRVLGLACISLPELKLHILDAGLGQNGLKWNELSTVIPSQSP
ncbi:hypothetical protein BJX76DRAFT_354346 [Aspergillus varians]